MSNKIKYGIKNVHYAVAQTSESGAITYGTPVPLPGAKSVTMSKNGTETEFYADNMVYYTMATNNGYDGTAELALIPESFLKDCLGEVLDTNKVLVEVDSAQPVHFALGFQIEGDVNETLFWFYNCTAERPDAGSSTKESSTDPGTETLSIKCRPGKDGIIRAKTSDTTEDTVRDAWFTSVYVPTTA